MEHKVMDDNGDDVGGGNTIEPPDGAKDDGDVDVILILQGVPQNMPHLVF